MKKTLILASLLAFAVSTQCFAAEVPTVEPAAAVPAQTVEQPAAPEVQKGNVKVSLNVKRLSQAFELNFQTEGIVKLICDRCLDEMNQPVHSVDRLVVKLGDEYAEEDDDLVVIPESEGLINVAWYMYEFIALAIPIKHVHAEGECNEEMSKKLGELSHTSTDDNMQVDPRWNELKRLLDNN